MLGAGPGIVKTGRRAAGLTRPPTWPMS